LKSLQMISQFGNITKILNTLPQIDWNLMTLLFCLKLANKCIFTTLNIEWFLLLITKLSSLKIILFDLFSLKQIELITKLVDLIFHLRSASILYLNVFFIIYNNYLSICARHQLRVRWKWCKILKYVFYIFSYLVTIFLNVNQSFKRLFIIFCLLFVFLSGHTG
jgi:hypothetical protein